MTTIGSEADWRELRVTKRVNPLIDYLDIRRGNISNDIGLVIDDGERCDSLVIHDLKRFTERFVPTGLRLAINRGRRE